MRKIVPLLFLLMILSLIFWDKPLSWYFHDHPNSFLIGFSFLVSFLADPGYHVLLWPIVFFYVRFIRKKEALGNDFLLISFSVIFTMVLVIFLKMLFGRQRPELFFTHNIYAFTPFQCHAGILSFPSGHGGNVGAIFGSLICLRKKYTLPFVLLAFLLSFTRIILSYHYLSDIFAGMIVGFVVSGYIYEKMKKTAARFA